MCNLRDNITSQSSAAALYICLFLKDFVFYIMKSLIQKRILLQGSTKTQPKKRMFSSYSCMLLTPNFS